MRISHVRFRNFGPFADLTLDLKCGSIGVFGRNGAGKSTLLNGLFGLVTNDFSRFEGLKVDCVRNVAGEGDPSFVYGVLHHNQRTLKITRRLRGKPLTELIVDDNEAITNSDKAQEKIEEVLGVGADMLKLYVFKEQDKIYDFLSTTPAERAKAFAVLCKTQKCEEAWDALGEWLNKDSELNTQIIDNSDELTQELAQLATQVSDLEAAISGEKEHLLNAKSELSAREILRKQDRLEDLVVEKSKVKSKIKDLAPLAEKWRTRLAKRRKAGEEVRDQLKEMKPQAEDARAALKGMEQYQKYRRRRRELKEQLEALVEEEKRTKAPKLPEELEGVAALDELVKCFNAWEAQLAEASKTVLRFDQEGVVACPTCKTPVDKLEGYLDEQRELVKSLPKDIKAVQAQISLWNEYLTAQRKHEKWKAGYDARLKANQEARESLKGVEAPDGDEAELKRVIAQYEAREVALEEARQRYQEAADKLKGFEADLASAEGRLSEVEAAIQDNTEEPELVEKARRRLAEHAAAKENIARHQGQLEGVQQQIESRESDLKKLRARLKRSKKVRQAAKIAERAREVLHRDCLPRRVAQINLVRMEGDINEGLGFFGEPFWAEADDSLSFRVHKPGEPPQPAQWLSTGQRVVLAMAFWPAVASLWSSDLGMLCLDEPTANLDEENRKFLGQALGALSVKVRDKRQVVMVTHDQNLRNAFDQVVDLG